MERLIESGSRLFCILFIGLASATLARADAGVTYHGRLLKPNGEPVTSSAVHFRVQIRTPISTNCLMYEETQVKDLSASNGTFSLVLNDGSAAVPNGEPFTLDRVFQNRGTFSFGVGKCSMGNSYEPGPFDGRVLAVSFNDGDFGGWEPLPSQAISFVPTALEA
ncbi:MAG TPA: hypothetical protein PL182_05720, partial [Pseudobdellovibrionaceae bacterium]|nr:hypothetical protein [Pseudobdellovibrionaceae bacterium]